MLDEYNEINFQAMGECNDNVQIIAISSENLFVMVKKSNYC
jgi:hypothetical protein